MSNPKQGKLKIGVVVIILVAAVAVGAGYFFTTSKKKTVKIGAVIALSGAASHMVAVLDGLQFAVDELNQWGGINGQPVELIVADSRSNPQEAIKAFREIEAGHQPLFYIATNSNVAVALAPLAEEYQVPLAGLVVSAADFTQINPWLFRYYSGSGDEVKATINTLKRLRIKKLGVIYQDDPYGTSVLDQLREVYGKEGGMIQSEPFKPGNPEFSGPIEKLKGMDGIYVIGFSNILSKAIKQLKQVSYPGAILTASGLRASEEVNGVYATAPIIYNPNNVFVQKVKETYETKYKKDFTHYVATGYDFLKLMAGLMEEKKLTRDSLRQALSGGFSHNGTFGNFTVSPGDRDIYFPLFPVRVADGKFDFLQ